MPALLDKNTLGQTLREDTYYPYLDLVALPAGCFLIGLVFEPLEVLSSLTICAPLEASVVLSTLGRWPLSSLVVLSVDSQHSVTFSSPTVTLVHLHFPSAEVLYQLLKNSAMKS